MTSNMITGERRWASARRGGMTVLGKVAVPKPINLPSQKLENHGLDPNVEIVPKGTLGWGSRPSSAGSNAWGSSALSPSMDGGSSSPSYLAGRPSSGGGTRPSTSGSERLYDSSVNVWGPNSRPSSASGVVGSNNASLTSSRPRSADTRPGSSHLSRFAEPSPEVSGARSGASASSERMELATSANKVFSLSSGDFPTLGSEKDEPGRNLETIDHGSPGQPSSSPDEGRPMVDTKENLRGDDAREPDFSGNFWRKECPPFVEDGPWPTMERWHGDPNPYHIPDMGPHHYESWRGAPPGGVWYRGPPGPPYGGPVPRGGFHMEPFPYYRPHVPAPGLANSQAVPPLGAGHRGHHPNNGDMFRPHMPESFMRPGMPMRPGFYPGPVPYDTYYRPPVGFHNPNERDLSCMGIAAGPPVFSRPPNQNAPDLSLSHPGSRDIRGLGPVDPGTLHDHRGNCKVLVKPNDGWNQDDEKWGPRVVDDFRDHEKGILSKATLHENAWGDDCKKDHSIEYSDNVTIEDIPSQSLERYNCGHSANPKFSGRVSNVGECVAGPVRDNITSSNHSLIQKIEGLNAKVRSSGGRDDGTQREEPTNRMPEMNVKAQQPMSDTKSEVFLERHYPSGILVPVSCDSEVGLVGRSGELTVTPGPSRPVHGAQSRGITHGKGRLNAQEDHGWGKKFHSVPAVGFRSMSTDQVEDRSTAVQSTELMKPSDVESAIPGLNSGDIQRAKMREIAKQRAIQLQKEEEERIRDQKAKALAKLEELNRRSASQVAEIPSEKESVLQKQDNSGNQLDPEANPRTGSGLGAGGFNNPAQVNEKSGCNVAVAVTSGHIGAEAQGNAHKGMVISQLPATDVNFSDHFSNTSTPQVPEVYKRVGYKQRQNVPSEKGLSRNPVGRADMLKDHKSPNTNQEVTGGSKVDGWVEKDLSEQVLVPDKHAPQKRRNNNSGKSKHKTEESSSGLFSAEPLQNNSCIAQSTSGNFESNASSAPVNPISVQLTTDPITYLQSSESQSSLSREDAPGRVNNAWKPQHSRKVRNAQGNRLSEKTQSNDASVWAPVRSHNNGDAAVQISGKAAQPFNTLVAGDSSLHNSSRTKRAEMEIYVPKPVAKELAQQGSIPQPPCHLVGGREKASQSSESLVKAGPYVESRNVDGKNRHARVQGTWRERVSVEPSSAQESQEILFSSISTRENVEAPSGLQQAVRSSESMMKESMNRPDVSVKLTETSVSDGRNTLDSSSTSFHTGVKDHSTSGRGKRHPFKGPKSSGNHRGSGNKDSIAGLVVSPRSPETKLTEKIHFSKENRTGECSASHWQPKAQAHVVLDEQRNTPDSVQNFVTEDGKGSTRETDSDGSAHLQNSPYTAKEPMPGSEKYKVLVEARPNVGPQDFKWEKKGSHPKGRSQSPMLASAVDFESTTFGAVDRRNEQQWFSSGYRKNANYSGHANRGLHGDRGTTAHGSQQHYSSANRERQRQNSQHAYEPVGSYSSNNSELQMGNQAGGTYRERGQYHSRRGRGNINGRQSGNE